MISSTTVSALSIALVIVPFASGKAFRQPLLSSTIASGPWTRRWVPNSSYTASEGGIWTSNPIGARRAALQNASGAGRPEPSSIGRTLGAEVKDLIGAVRGPVGRRRRCRFVRVDGIYGCNGCVVRRRLQDPPRNNSQLFDDVDDSMFRCDRERQENEHPDGSFRAGIGPATVYKARRFLCGGGSPSTSGRRYGRGAAEGRSLTFRPTKPRPASFPWPAEERRLFHPRAQRSSCSPDRRRFALCFSRLLQYERRACLRH